MQHRLRYVISVLAAAVILLLALVHWGARFYTDWLWFGSVHYQQVFLTILLSAVGLRLAVWALVFAVLFANLFFTRRPIVNAAGTARRIQEGDVVTLVQPSWSRLIAPRTVTLLFAAASLILAFLISEPAAGNWLAFQQFLHPAVFNIQEPIFHRDAGFYVFRLPFLILLYRLLLWTAALSLLLVSAIYVLSGAASGGVRDILNSPSARRHLSILLAILLFIRAWGYRLDQYLLLYSEHGVVYGAGYTDIHARLVAYKILLVLCLSSAAILLINIVLGRLRPLIYSIGILVVAAIVLNGIYPALMQKFLVLPTEQDKERPYIENGIKFTRLTYDLNNIESRLFPAGGTLTPPDIKNNEDTIKNIRLWDYRPLQQTYSQLQEMRLYYEFKGIDVDRYTIDGHYRQVMLAARELNQEQLPEQAKTWVNEHLKYTHGYGIVMSPVNEINSDGLPRLLIKDIPPVTGTDLKITRPEIYYGESTDNYVAVNARGQEFDYPKGNDNAWCTYQGHSGVDVHSFWRRLMFALSFSDYKLLLSGDITNSSKLLYYRNIKQRVPKIVPFLTYDSDPYIVLNNGRLYWIWDAYTTTGMFPYAEPAKPGFNYIRNAVKVAVDAYNGDVTYYAADPGDPILQSYSHIFPGLFKPLANMPAGLRSHLRYPEDMFMIQAQKYATYHMTDYRVFYNKEDKWNLPTEVSGTNNEEQPMEPYYTIARLPGDKQPEFIQILPFTPQNKKNMVAWLAGRSDGSKYGKLLVYEFPKQQLVYGPAQVEARIDQDTTISQQLSLWSQRGSTVYRGNLMIIPVKDSLIYVEPLYLQAEQSKIPELSRVVVALGDQVVMEPTLEQALNRIFNGQLTQTGNNVPGIPPATGESVSGLAEKANQIYNQALTRLKAGDWAGYGESMQQLKTILLELQLKTK
ncbi:UPF0182 family protein [Desulfotomaculum copahuensis]|uniref:UPF0182 protein A6M21_10790 n=1 Tax=Desulfotomaculum copahuensis TaxID=1838280 RepID=A0A1B7LE36_9FIRM|nr:UPF0182 family protein [Desulfotomaculum copahuensis]OAT81359.1 hypothetical protein A6M21_10790 [Desulfotomaculum copahuensis]